jgi:hypothetical protein
MNERRVFALELPTFYDDDASGSFAHVVRFTECFEPHVCRDESYSVVSQTRRARQSRKETAAFRLQVIRANTLRVIFD